MAPGKAGWPVSPGQLEPISGVIQAGEADRSGVHPGSPGDHKARFIRLHRQEPTDAGTGHFRPNHVFGFLQRRNHAQVSARRNALEILCKKILRKIHGYISIFNLNRNVVLKMNQKHVVDSRSGGNMEQVGNVRRYATCLQINYGRSMFVSPHLNLVGDIANFKQIRSCLQIRYKRADTGHALHVTLVGQFSQCPVCRHARHPGGPDEFVFGWNAIQRPKVSTRDSGDYLLLQLLVAWLGARSHIGTAASVRDGRHRLAGRKRLSIQVIACRRSFQFAASERSHPTAPSKYASLSLC